MPELNLELLKNRKRTSSKVRPYDYDIPIPNKKDRRNDPTIEIKDHQSNSLKEVAKQKSIKPVTKNNVKEPFTSNSKQKKRRMEAHTINLSTNEIKELKLLSNDKINELDDKSKIAIRSLLNSLKGNKNKELTISYHAQILLDIIKRNISDNLTEVLFSYDDIESFGLRRKYIKKSYEELALSNLIEVSQVIHEGKIKNKYRIIC